MSTQGEPQGDVKSSVLPLMLGHAAFSVFFAALSTAALRLTHRGQSERHRGS